MYLLIANCAYHHAHFFANGRSLPLRNLQPVALVEAESPYAALAIAVGGAANAWQSDASVRCTLGRCTRPMTVGDLIFDNDSNEYRMLSERELIDMHLDRDRRQLRAVNCLPK